MTDSPILMEDGSDQELSHHSEQIESLNSMHVGSNRLPNGIMPMLSDNSEVTVLRDENSRLLATLLDYKKMLDSNKLRYNTIKREYYAAKKRLKRLANKLQAATAGGGVNAAVLGVGLNAHNSGSSESGGSTPAAAAQPQIPTTVDEDIRKKWKEPNLKAAVKLKAAVGVQSYQSLIRDGELQLPSLRTISRYVDALKKAGLKPNYDFNVRDSDAGAVGNVFMEEEGEDSADVDHNRNQQQLGKVPFSREVSDAEDPVNCTAVPDINFFRDKMDDDDPEEDLDEEPHQPPSDLYQNGGDLPNGGDIYRRHPNQHTYQQQTLTVAHIEFLKSMTGFRKKWTPFELRTCMDIRRIIGCKEYDSLRKNDGMPLPSAKTLRKYKHAVHLDGVDVMGRKRSYHEMVEGHLGAITNGHVPSSGMNGRAGSYGDDLDDLLNAEEPGGHFDINNLTEQQFDFLQSLSSNTKGFSDYELQRTLELKNELGGANYEILRKQECLHIPTLMTLKKYEQENGLEDLSAMVGAAEDVDEEDDQEPEQEPEPDYDQELLHGGGMDEHFPRDMMNGGTGGEDSHMGIFEHHSIFDKDAAFDMGKLSQEHIEFLNSMLENPKRWTQQMINSALSIKNEIGTRDYELLRRQGIPLPAARTLRRHKDLTAKAQNSMKEEEASAADLQLREDGVLDMRVKQEVLNDVVQD